MTGVCKQEISRGCASFAEQIRVRAQKAGCSDPNTNDCLAVSQVYLVAGGQAGEETVKTLAALPLGHLSVQPVSKGEAARYDSILKDSPLKSWGVFPNDFDIYGAALQLKMHQVLMYSAAAPVPFIQDKLNEAAVRLSIPYLQGTLFAHDITLGPGVLPGISACHNCYKARLRANYRRTDVPDAVERFLNKNPSFDFRGGLPVLSRMLSSMLATDLSRLLGGGREPVSIGRELIINGLNQERSESFVPYLEWCPVCSDSRAEVDLSEFKEFVRSAAGHVGQTTGHE